MVQPAWAMADKRQMRLLLAPLLLTACVGESTPPSLSCQTSAQCGASGLCVEGLCSAALLLTLDTALAASYGDDGLPWDPSTGSGLSAAPDAFATVEVDGVEVCRTTVVADSFDPQWHKACPITLSVDSQVRFEVQDVDVPPDSPGAAGAERMYLKFVKGGDLTIGLSGNEHQDAFVKMVFRLTAP